MLKKMSFVLVDNGIIDKEDAEIYEYGLFVVLFNMLCMMMVLSLGLLFDQLYFTLSFLLFYLPNRMIIGGYHCDTPHRCFLTFSLMYFLVLLMNSIVGYQGLFYSVGIHLYVLMLVIYFRKENDSKYKFFLISTFILFLIITYYYSFMRLPMFYAIVVDSILFYIE